MTDTSSSESALTAKGDAADLILRPIQYSDLDAVEALFREAFTDEYGDRAIDISSQIQRMRRWYGPIKALSVFPNRFQHLFTVHVAERDRDVLGMIQVSPFNHARTTWRIDHVAVSSRAQRQGIGSRLLRHCMEHFREAHTWMLEVNIHNKGAMSLYRRNGFQPLAQVTYWSIPPDRLADLAKSKPSLPNLLLAGNSDAPLIYQLDTASMPPLVRQVYDRHADDFRSSLFDRGIESLKQSVSNTERVRAYVLEPQRKAAIGYFNLKVARAGTQPHVAQLTVHPAYTWLYPELMAQMAREVQSCPQPQPLYLASTDYQTEREEFLLKIGAEDMERTLLMSRSVWHKVRESRVKFENLPLESMLRSLQVKQPLPEPFDRVSMDSMGSTSGEERPDPGHS
ncbi:MAG: GNAT family N-acetyltransferase [Cyanobacteria bacterium P01_F01_bin.33]